MSDHTSSYVLVTAARNEQEHIESTLRSVIVQTVLPRRWVIVSDGSTDDTDEIVKRYQAHCDFIELVRRDTSESRNYGSKVIAIRRGIQRLEAVPYEFIGNLDGDVAFGCDYYRNILQKFRENPKLGIAGGRVFEYVGQRRVRGSGTMQSVHGTIQMFRRLCYEDIGGYTPSAIGAVDAIAEITARMKGWQVRTFPAEQVVHLRRMGTAGQHILAARFKEGRQLYGLGSHPLFEFLKCLYRLPERPKVLGSLARLGGYLWACLCRQEAILPPETSEYLHREQVLRVRCALFGTKRPSDGSPVPQSLH